MGTSPRAFCQVVSIAYLATLIMSCAPAHEEAPDTATVFARARRQNKRDGQPVALRFWTPTELSIIPSHDMLSFGLGPDGTLKFKFYVERAMRTNGDSGTNGVARGREERTASLLSVLEYSGIWREELKTLAIGKGSSVSAGDRRVTVSRRSEVAYVADLSAWRNEDLASLVEEILRAAYGLGEKERPVYTVLTGSISRQPSPIAPF